MDWGDALAVPTFYGREGELALLSQWMLQERCRVEQPKLLADTEGRLARCHFPLEKRSAPAKAVAS